MNFTGFRGFTWISRLRNHAKYQKPCNDDHDNNNDDKHDNDDNNSDEDDDNEFNDITCYRSIIMYNLQNLNI